MTTISTQLSHTKFLTTTCHLSRIHNALSQQTINTQQRIYNVDHAQPHIAIGVDNMVTTKIIDLTDNEDNLKTPYLQLLPIPILPYPLRHL